MAAWDKLLSDQDRQVFRMSGHGARGGLGETPVVLVIDVNYSFCGDKDEPITESVKTWRYSCGHDAWKALPVVQGVLKAARAQGVPVIYATGKPRKDTWDAAATGWKNSRTHEGSEANNINGSTIMPQIAPAPDDMVMVKSKPSVFFGTPLVSYLNHLKADTILVMGCSTSGCVRATVVDGFSYNYRMAVIEDGCFDRYQLAHAASLFDMNAKYADVMPSSQARSYIEGLPSQTARA